MSVITNFHCDSCRENNSLKKRLEMTKSFIEKAEGLQDKTMVQKLKVTQREIEGEIKETEMKCPVAAGTTDHVFFE